MAGAAAFREAFMSTDSANADNFIDINARRLRYSIFWAMYENSAYRSIHKWSAQLKTTYGLYKYIRNIYNPSNRLISFWQTHLMGGFLDPEAGDGKATPSALPIETDNDALRESVARLWRDSVWQVNKDIFTLYGPLMGDAGLRINDDPGRQYVSLQVVHPNNIRDVTLDAQGNVKAYELEETRLDPRPGILRQVKYRETAKRGEGEDVIFQTFLDDQPYAWNPEQGAEWTEPYGFIPLVVAQHNNVGAQYGWSELQPGISKFREVDDQASLLNDQIRKTVNAIPMFIGVKNSGTTPTINNTTPTNDKPEPGREELPALYAPTGADLKWLVAPLQIEETAANIKNLIEEIERDYPELQSDIWTVTGDTSGKALRVARQRSEAKVNQRRPNYDDALKRAQQMAIAIGGFRNYEGYQGFDLNSYKAGNLEHSIGKRPVFAVDPLDDLERDKMFWDVASSVKTTGGLPALGIWLKQQGWNEEDIKKVLDAPDNKPFVGYP